MASGASSTWFGGTGSWDNAANWTPTGLPAATGTAIIDAGLASVEGGFSATTARGSIGDGAVTSGTVSVAGFWRNTGTLFVGGTGTGYLNIGQTGSVTTAVSIIGTATVASGTAIVAGL